MDVQISQSEPAGWNEFLLSVPSGNFMQTTYYADYARNDVGHTPYYIRSSEEGQTRAQLLLFESCRYYGLKNRFPHRLVYPLIQKLFRQSYWAYGPVSQDPVAVKALLKEVKNWARRKKIGIGPSSTFPLSNFGDSFDANGFSKHPAATFIIDLNRSEDELWKNIDKSARKLVSRTLQQVHVRELQTSEDHQKYMQVVNENRRRNNLSALPYSEGLWNAFKRNDAGTVFIAEKDGKVFGGLGISHFNGYLNEWGAGTSNQAISEKVYASDAIKWQVIQWAKQKGFRYFDLSGVKPNPQTEKEKGIFRFKEKWGGLLVHRNEYFLARDST